MGRLRCSRLPLSVVSVRSPAKTGLRGFAFRALLERVWGGGQRHAPRPNLGTTSFSQGWRRITAQTRGPASVSRNCCSESYLADWAWRKRSRGQRRGCLNLERSAWLVPDVPPKSAGAAGHLLPGAVLRPICGARIGESVGFDPQRMTRSGVNFRRTRSVVRTLASTTVPTRPGGQVEPRAEHLHPGRAPGPVRGSLRRELALPRISGRGL